jgi:hypothetical protein
MSTRVSKTFWSHEDLGAHCLKQTDVLVKLPSRRKEICIAWLKTYQILGHCHIINANGCVHVDIKLFVAGDKSI